MHKQHEPGKLKKQARRPEDKMALRPLAERRHVPTSLNMAGILTKALPRKTFVRCIANALNPDDILPPIAQNEGEC
jgi:hypothetical protein